MAQLISESDAATMYDDMLNECSPGVKVAGIEFDASRVLEELDPTAYRCGFIDYVDSLAQDDIYVEGYTDNQMPENETEEE